MTTPNTRTLIGLRFAELCKELNKDTRPYVDGKGNVGAWYIDNQPMYGGYEICEMTGTGGGIRQVTGWCNRMKPKEFLAYLEGALMVIKTAKDMVLTGQSKNNGFVFAETDLLAGVKK